MTNVVVDDKLCDAVAVPQNHKPITALVVYPTTQADVYVGVRLVQLPAVVCPFVKLLLDGRGFCNKPCVQTSASTVHLSVSRNQTGRRPSWCSLFKLLVKILFLYD